jgi:uncharacterized protein YjbI with pentapeptide repeats
MANQQHLARLRSGLSNWNNWRERQNKAVQPDFSSADLSDMDLSGVNLSSADLSNADLSGTNLIMANLNKAYFFRANLSRANFFRANLSGAILSSVILHGANFKSAILKGTDLSGAYLNSQDLREIDLSDVNLSGAYLSSADLTDVNLNAVNLRGANLSETNLSRANLRKVNLRGASLIGANFSGSDLSGADLESVQALGTNFTGANLTGANIKDWNINVLTKLDEVECEYVYCQGNGQERRPRDLNRIFYVGEFTKLFQKALETVDLIFSDGIDWKAFSHSLQKLKQQYSESDVSIQAIERKNDEAFVIRLQVDSGVNKAEIERVAIEQYRVALKIVQTKYSERLKAKDEQIAIYRQESAKMEGIVNVLATRTMANINDFRGANFGGGAAVGEGATQVGGTYNDFSQTISNNFQEIQKLITALRSQAVCFPPAKREETEVHIGDLEEDLRQPEKRDPKRIKARLLALLMIAGMIGGTVATATDFTNNVLELGKKFGIELIQP